MKIDELLRDFDAVSFYRSAMLDEKTKYPKIETGFAFTEDMNDELVEKLILVILRKEVLFRDKLFQS